MTRNRKNNLPEANPAKKAGFWEGVEARKAGKPCNSPYADANDRPIPAFTQFHEGWISGWKLKDADILAGKD